MFLIMNVSVDGRVPAHCGLPLNRGHSTCRERHSIHPGPRFGSGFRFSIVQPLLVSFRNRSSQFWAKTANYPTKGCPHLTFNINTRVGRMIRASFNGERPLSHPPRTDRLPDHKNITLTIIFMNVFGKMIPCCWRAVGNLSAWLTHGTELALKAVRQPKQPSIPSSTISRSNDHLKLLVNESFSQYVPNLDLATNTRVRAGHLLAFAWR